MGGVEQYALPFGCNRNFVGAVVALNYKLLYDYIRFCKLVLSVKVYKSKACGFEKPFL